MLLSLGKGVGLYLYIEQVDIEGSSRVGSLCIYVTTEMHHVCPILYA